MVTIIICIVCLVGGIAAVGLWFFGPRPARKAQREERSQRQVEDDIIPLIGLGIIGLNPFEGESAIEHDEDYTEFPEDWEDDDELMGW